MLLLGSRSICRIHQRLRITPAMEAKITDHVWDIEELLDKVMPT